MADSAVRLIGSVFWLQSAESFSTPIEVPQPVLRPALRYQNAPANAPPAIKDPTPNSPNPVRDNPATPTARPDEDVNSGGVLAGANTSSSEQSSSKSLPFSQGGINENERSTVGINSESSERSASATREKPRS